MAAKPKPHQPRARAYREGLAQLNFEVDPEDRKKLKIEAAKLGVSMQALGQMLIKNAVSKFKG